MGATRSFLLAGVHTRGSRTSAERRLAEGGEADTVLGMRGKFQQAMRRDMVAVVERVTGRRVMAFMSANHLEPDMACEIFVLEPVAGRLPA